MRAPGLAAIALAALIGSCTGRPLGLEHAPDHSLDRSLLRVRERPTWRPCSLEGSPDHIRATGLLRLARGLVYGLEVGLGYGDLTAGGHYLTSNVGPAMTILLPSAKVKVVLSAPQS